NTSTSKKSLTNGNICAIVGCDSSTPASSILPLYVFLACFSITLHQESKISLFVFKHFRSLAPANQPFVLYFHVLAHSFALFCTHPKLNSIVFIRLRTLRQKPPGVGVPPLPVFASAPSCLFQLRFPFGDF